jgi:hypothetical protein
MDWPTASLAFGTVVTFSEVIVRWPRKPNGNGYKSAISEHAANCEIKEIVQQHNVTIAVLREKLSNIDSNVIKICDKIDRQG